MENNRPIVNSLFAGSTASNLPKETETSQIDILRESNRQFKLKIINMTKEKSIEIVNNLKQTLAKMGSTDGLYSDNPMFKMPRAKRSDLLKKKKELIKKYNL